MSKEEARAYNMDYLSLNGEQYDRHCGYMENMSTMPPALKEYCRQQSKVFGFCGDALACWIADWIRAN